MANGNMPSGGSGPNGAPNDASLQKLRNSREYLRAKEKMLKKLGGKTLEVVRAEISKKDIKKEAEGVAIDETEKWEETNSKMRAKQREDKLTEKVLSKYDETKLNAMSDDEKQKLVEDYKEKHNGLLSKFGNALKNIPVALYDNVRRSVMLSGLKKQAVSAIEKTGRLEAGKLAAKNYRELQGSKTTVLEDDGITVATDEAGNEITRKRTKKENAKEALRLTEVELSGLEKDENRFLDRVRSKATSDGNDEFANDTKVTIEKNDYKNVEQDSERGSIKEAYAEYMYAVATASSKKGGDSAAVKKAKKAFKEKFGNIEFDQKDGISYDNSDELLDTIKRDYRGVFDKDISGNKAKKAREQAARDAIDEYLENNLKIMSGRIKTGLDIKNSAEKNADKAVLKYGAIIGGAVSLGGMMLKATSRSKIVKAFDTAAGAMGIKMLIAGTLGAVAGAVKKNQGQKYEEMRQAIGAEAQEEGDVNHYRKISVDETIKQLKDAENALRAGKDIEENSSLIANTIGDLRARIKIQEKDKVALMSYAGRDSIEKQKYELLQEMSNAKYAIAEMRAKQNNTDSLNEFEKADEIIKLATEEASERLLKEKAAVNKVKHAERRHAAWKGAVTAATVAGVITFASDLAFKGGTILSEMKQGAKWGLGEIKKVLFGSSAEAIADDAVNGIVGTEAAAVVAGTTAKVAETMDNRGGINLPKITEEDLPNFENKNIIDYKPGAAVIIEDDPQGGVAIGFDNNGNGVIDDGEFLRGEGVERGINLTSNTEYESIRDELKENYNLDLQREAIDSTKYDQIAVNNYLESVDNTVDVKGAVLDTDSYNVSLGVPEADYDVDGMMQYTVDVEGDYPDGTKLFIDLDGSGNGKVLEFSIENGKAVIPADVVDTSEVGNNGVANFFGRATVGRMEGGKIVSYVNVINGTPLGATDSMTAAVTESGYAFTVLDEQGETLSSFAVNTQGKSISNLSEIFNGIGVGESGRLPAGFSAVEGIEDRGTLASGEKLPDVGDYHGGYNAQYDSSTNYPFKNNNHSLVGTPMTWDADGDGVMNGAEEASYIKQMFVRTATNPYVLGQNASNYGLLEPDALAKNLFDGDANAMTETLKAWGVSDGMIDSEKELQAFLDHLKMGENSDYYDKLVNSTISEMQDQLAGGGFEQETLTDRISTYINKDGSIDTKGNGSLRTVLYPYKTGPDGEKIYVGNKGWWVRKYYGEEGGKVGDLPLCEQKAVVIEEEDIVTTTPERIITTTTPERIITTTTPERIVTTTTPERIVTTTTPERIVTTTTPERIITTTTPERIVTTTTPERIVTTTTPERIVTTTTPERIVTTTTPERIITTTTPERIITTTTPERIITTTTPERIITTTTPERIITTTTPERIITTTTPERIITTTTPERIITTTTLERTGKDVERRAEIDKELNEEIAKDVNTEGIEFGEAEEVNTENLTEATPDTSTYGTTADTVEHDNSLLYGDDTGDGSTDFGTTGSGDGTDLSGTSTETPGPTNIEGTLEPEHDYSDNLGGANFDEGSAEELVPEDVDAQKAANAAAAATEPGETITTMDDLDDDFWSQFGL